MDQVGNLLDRPRLYYTSMALVNWAAGCCPWVSRSSYGYPRTPFGTRSPGFSFSAWHWRLAT